MAIKVRGIIGLPIISAAIDPTSGVTSLCMFALPNMVIIIPAPVAAHAGSHESNERVINLKYPTCCPFLLVTEIPIRWKTGPPWKITPSTTGATRLTDNPIKNRIGFGTGITKKASRKINDANSEYSRYSIPTVMPRTPTRVSQSIRFSLPVNELSFSVVHASVDLSLGCCGSSPKKD